MNRELESAPKRHLVLPIGGALIALGLLWLVHGSLLSVLVRWALPWVAASAGYEATVSQVQAGLFAPVRLSGVEATRPGGTHLRAKEIDLHWAGWGLWEWKPSSWIRRMQVRGLSARIMPVAAATGAGSDAAPAVPSMGWPSVLEVEDGDVSLIGHGWQIDLHKLDLLLDEGRSGFLRVPAAEAKAGQDVKKFKTLRAVTAWRDGAAYFADLSLDENVVIDVLSVALAGPPALALKARVGGGYVYADISGRGASTKAALNALNVSLDGVAKFAGIDGDMAGTIDLAKITFNGDPAQPLSAQISLRLEAKDFAWRKNAVQELTAGLSFAGRRVRLSEYRLRQKSNDVKLRGTLTLPPASSDWREAPFEFDVDADVGDLRALAGLFGAPWNGLSGGLRIEGRGSGTASDGEGWLKVRGWDLRARGIPTGTMQADVLLAGRDLKLTGLEAQSGPDFARGSGQITLGDPLSYQGRLELRVREVSRYLAPLGRFAPDWARQGGVLLFWDGDGTSSVHSGVATLELVRFTGDLNPVPLNGKLSASYSPGNIYLSRILLDRGPLSLSSTVYFGGDGLTVQDLQVFSGRSRLLRGEMFLPLSLDAVLARQSWEQTLRKEGEVYVAVRSDKLDLESLVELFGQETTLRGRADLRLDARGPWENAIIDGSLSVNGLQAALPSLKIPDALASLDLRVKERRASIEGRLQPGGTGEIKWQADVPLLGTESEGRWTLIDASKKWTASLEIAPTDLARFSPVFAGAVLDRGILAGKVQLTGTFSSPLLEGTLEMKNGRLSFGKHWLPMEDVETRIVLAAEEAVLETARGRMGEGSFGLAGRLDFNNPQEPVWEFQMHGEGLSLYADENFLIKAAPEIEGRGTKEAGKIGGKIDLDGSAVRRGLLVKPRLVDAAAPDSRAPSASGLRPFAPWVMDIRLSSAGPIPVGVEGAQGSLAPDLYLQGTVGEPLLLGTVRADRLPVVWPSGARLAADGRVHFTPEKPWLPVVDLAGTGEAGAYGIRAGAFGPVDGRNLLVSSAPPMTTEQIVLLLTTGLSPVPAANAGTASLNPREKIAAEPSWLDLGKVRGLFGWSTDSGDDAAVRDWSIGDQAASYDWSWH